MTCNPRHRMLPAPRLELPAEQALARSRAFLETMRTRRTVRDFSDRAVPLALLGCPDPGQTEGVASSGDQITKASSSTATATRRFASSSTASS
jgi:hypothetical protein